MIITCKLHAPVGVQEIAGDYKMNENLISYSITKEVHVSELSYAILIGYGWYFFNITFEFRRDEYTAGHVGIVSTSVVSRVVS